MDDILESQAISPEEEIYEYFVPNHVLGSGADATLSALAQLATLRTRTARALVSLIDDKTQYILVEATQTSRIGSFGTDNANNLLFGRMSLSRSMMLCGKALDLLPRQGPRSPFVVSDIQDDARLKDEPFVASHRAVRFFASMPITTKSGANIGAISVMDEVPRPEGLSDAEMVFMDDLSLAVMAHLEMTRAQEGERRSEKMIKGLGIFMKGRTDLNDWWLELGNTPPPGAEETRPQPQADNRHQKEMSTSSTTGIQEQPGPRKSMEAAASGPLQFRPHRSNSTKTIPPRFINASFSLDRQLVSTPMEYARSDGDAATTPARSERHTAPPAPKTVFSVFNEKQQAQLQSATKGDPPDRGQSASTIFIQDFQENAISAKLKEMFIRAGHIIQESIEVDGALFLDASISASSNRSESMTFAEIEQLSATPTPHNSGSDAPSTEPESAVDNESAAQQSKDTATSHRAGENRVCEVLGLWTSEHSSLHGDGASKLVPATESFLHSLLNKYPRGHVFGPGELGAPHTKARRHSKRSDELMEAHSLSKMLPGSRSIAFVPLWDTNKGRGFAGSFFWTVLPTERVLTHSGDLNYLAAFGNSIMAEVNRLDVVGADRAKSDFISSISHELRSPLHGILASAELLHDTTVDLFQYGMIDTIERCGRTLLDTIQHVLDFARINTFTRSRLRPGIVSRQEPLLSVPNINANIDLSLLVEDVVDAVFAGHQFQTTEEGAVVSPGHRRQNNSVDIDAGHFQGGQENRKGPVDVVVDIERRDSWVFHTESGALRRVLMNLFGNALKYTDSGCILVSLQAKDLEPARGRGPKSVITLIVSDTGRGIGQDYLHNGLFTPFTQEDPMNPGTGLGLSIVLQIVRSLAGKVEVTSAVGVGTEVVVTLTMTPAPSSQPHLLTRSSQSSIQRAKERTEGISIGLTGFNVQIDASKRRSGDWHSPSDPSLYLQTSIERAASQWFGMKIAPPSSWKSSPPDIYVANEDPGILGAFGGVPTIVLCSHEKLYREYGQDTTQGSRRGNTDLIHFVSKPCGPHKLARAFEFFLSKTRYESNPSSSASHPERHRVQSLFAQSPDDTPKQMQPLVPPDYFGQLPHNPIVPSRAQSDNVTPVTTTATTTTITTTMTTTTTVTEENKKPLLLLVEDNEINLRLLSHLVFKNNYPYETAVNGLKALEAFQSAKTPYDIVIMDISMPVMDGLESTREIRKWEHSQQGQRQRPPAMIIALTGLGSATTRKEAFESGVNLFLTKPVQLKELRRILEGWLPGAGTSTFSSR